MEDIVAIQVKINQREKIYFLTWGRIFNPIKSEELVDCLKQNLFKFGINKFESIKLCESLQGASKAKYFFESYFHMCQRKINFGKDYEAWRRKTKKEMSKGKEIYLLGK